MQLHMKTKHVNIEKEDKIITLHDFVYPGNPRANWETARVRFPLKRQNINTSPICQPYKKGVYNG